MSLYLVFVVLAVLPQPDPEIPPIAPIRLEDRLFMPYVDLLEPATYSHDELGSLRSRLEQERDEKIKSLQQNGEAVEEGTRRGARRAEDLTEAVQSTHPETVPRRSQLHVDIGAL